YGITLFLIGSGEPLSKRILVSVVIAAQAASHLLIVPVAILGIVWGIVWLISRKLFKSDNIGRKDSNKPSAQVSSHKIKNPQRDWIEIFGNDKPIYLEIGCDNKIWILKQAKKNLDKNYVAMEIDRTKGQQIIKAALPNLKIIYGNAKELVKAIFIDGQVKEIYINFPDVSLVSPCPYIPHLDKNFLQDLLKVLEKGGKIKIVSENEAYADITLKLLFRSLEGRKRVFLSNNIPGQMPSESSDGRSAIAYLEVTKLQTEEQLVPSRQIASGGAKSTPLDVPAKFDEVCAIDKELEDNPDEYGIEPLDQEICQKAASHIEGKIKDFGNKHMEILKQEDTQLWQKYKTILAKLNAIASILKKGRFTLGSNVYKLEIKGVSRFGKGFPKRHPGEKFALGAINRTIESKEEGYDLDLRVKINEGCIYTEEGKLDIVVATQLLVNELLQGTGLCRKEEDISKWYLPPLNRETPGLAEDGSPKVISALDRRMIENNIGNEAYKKCVAADPWYSQALPKYENIKVEVEDDVYNNRKCRKITVTATFENRRVTAWYASSGIQWMGDENFCAFLRKSFTQEQKTDFSDKITQEIIEDKKIKGIWKCTVEYMPGNFPKEVGDYLPPKRGKRLSVLNFPIGILTCLQPDVSNLVTIEGILVLAVAAVVIGMILRQGGENISRLTHEPVAPTCTLLPHLAKKAPGTSNLTAKQEKRIDLVIAKAVKEPLSVESRKAIAELAKEKESLPLLSLALLGKTKVELVQGPHKGEKAKVAVKLINCQDDLGFYRNKYKADRPVYERVTYKQRKLNLILKINITEGFYHRATLNQLAQDILHPLFELVLGLTHSEANTEEIKYNSEETKDSGVSDLNVFILQHAAEDNDIAYLNGFKREHHNDPKGDFIDKAKQFLARAQAESEKIIRKFFPVGDESKKIFRQKKKSFRRNLMTNPLVWKATWGVLGGLPTHCEGVCEFLQNSQDNPRAGKYIERII
ncbi:MAG: hypothetical protein JSW18_03755, partial [Candidatus Omnitrophota bacterium]